MPLEISHLVTSGCSFTYCQNLDDPATQGWPALLAKKLGVPIVNLGIPASGTDSIYRRNAEYFYLNKNNNSKPFFISAFSHALRREEYIIEYDNLKIEKVRSLFCYGNEPIERSIYENMDEKGIYFAEFRKLLNWLSTINLFKENYIPYLTTNYVEDHQSSIELIKSKHREIYDTVYNDENKIMDFHLLTVGTKKLPCGHDGVEAQKIIADYCYDIMIKKYEKIIPIEAKYVDLIKYIQFTSVPEEFIFHNHWCKNIFTNSI